jgi:hypothetical protein
VVFNDQPRAMVTFPSFEPNLIHCHSISRAIDFVDNVMNYHIDVVGGPEHFHTFQIFWIIEVHDF